MSRLAACPQSPRSQNPGAWYKVTYLKYFFWKVFLARIFHFLLQVQFLTSPEKCSEGERRWPRWSENFKQVFVSHANKSWKHPDSQKKKTLPRLSVSSTIATDGDKPGDLSVPRTSSSNRWSKGAVYCLLSSAFYLTNCTSDASRSSDICELRGSSRLAADERKIFSVKFTLVIVALRCVPSCANTEHSWGGSACRTMSASLQVFTDPSKRPSSPQHTVC